MMDIVLAVAIVVVVVAAPPGVVLGVLRVMGWGGA